MKKVKSQKSRVKSGAWGWGTNLMLSVQAANSYLLFVEVPLSTPADGRGHAHHEETSESRIPALSVKSY